MLRSASALNQHTHRVTLKTYDVFAFVVAAVYAIVLASLPLLEFRDRANYLIYGYASDLILQRNLAQGITTVLSNEPVWLLINIILASFLSPEQIIQVIIAFSAFIVSWITLRTRPRQFVWLLVFLLFPSVVKNYIIHLRQGLAIAIFMIGLLVIKPRILSWLFIGITPFIHASFFFVVGLLFLSRASRRLRLDSYLSIILFAAITIGIVGALEWVASGLGARQASEYELRGGVVVSGVNFVFWLIMLLLMVIQGRTFLRQHRFVISSIIFYLGTYFFTPITARVFESTLLLVLVSGLDLTGWRGHTFRFAVLGYGALQWASGIALASLLTEA
jgi:hypothetical protein